MSKNTNPHWGSSLDDFLKEEGVMAALEVGQQAIREGRTALYTPELLDQIEQEARQHAAEGRKPNPDVCS